MVLPSRASSIAEDNDYIYAAATKTHRFQTFNPSENYNNLK
jgi:hypothetical protein